MIQKVLTYLLVTMIAMQSFVAIADVHQPHQSGEQHLEFEHDHSDSETNIGELEVVKNASSESFNTSSLDEYDCHHCCHCHGVTYLKAVSEGSDVFPYKQSIFLSTSTDYLSHTLSPDLRPPIV